MPRITPENRSSSLFLSGSKPPPPPRDLDPPAAKLWRAITSSHPADYFADGASAAQLALLCQTMVALERAAKMMARELIGTPRATQAIADYKNLSLVAQIQARGLRLTKQAAHNRKAGILDEAGPGKMLDESSLIGGGAVLRRQ